MTYTRRDLGKLALAALPAARLLAAKPNSNWGGVQVGINIPYSYGNNNLSADETISNTVQLGLSAMELRTQPIESFLGSPAAGKTPPRTGRGAPPITPEQQAEQVALADQLRKWRLSLGPADFKRARAKFEDAGLAIQIVKVDTINNMDDDVVEYCFNLAKAVGAQAISCEIPLSRTKWLGAFADKHKMMVGYHGHTDITNPEAFGKPSSWETAMSYSKYNGINLDIGHFVAANKVSPAEFLRKYHDRVTHIHIKDKKFDNTNVAFGEGDTPIKEILHMMQKEKYTFQATIEFEYPVPEGSNRMTEIAKCVGYVKACLL
ncbi:MAG: TIM barrel protein [Ignavibacteriota bacterium]